MDSNFEYSFKLYAKVPCVSDLPAFHPGNKHTGETNPAPPRDRVVRFLRPEEGEDLAIIGHESDYRRVVGLSKWFAG